MRWLQPFFLGNIMELSVEFFTVQYFKSEDCKFVDVLQDDCTCYRISRKALIGLLLIGRRRKARARARQNIWM